MRTQIGKGERCDVSRYDVGIIRADGQLSVARSASFINNKGRRRREMDVDINVEVFKKNAAAFLVHAQVEKI